MGNGNLLLLFVTILAALFAVIAATEFAALAKAKKWDLCGIIKKAESLYGTAETIAAALAPFLPPPYGPMLTLIFTCADKAVKAAESAWQAGACRDTERKEKAEALVTDALSAQGVPVDDKVRSLVDIAIETLVKTLPKSHGDKAPADVSGTTPPQ